MKKLNLITSAIIAAISLPALAQDFSRADETYMTPSEILERNDANSPKGPQAGTLSYVVNEYQENALLPPVSAYVSNWGQYGRAFNIANVGSGYDKLVLSFFGMCGSQIGDPAITSAVDSLKTVCGVNNPNAWLSKEYAPEFSVVTTDPWGDMGSLAGGALNLSDQANADNPHWETHKNLANRWFADENRVAGMLGAVKKLKDQNPELELAFSIGGWSLSEPFSRMANDANARKVFVDSTVAIFERFPMFSQVDLDWEYPGGGGAEHNSKSDLDGDNYVTLIEELRTALSNKGFNDVKIAIAAGAPKNKLDASNLKGVTEAGVDIIHLMTYDFFGTPWAETLTHHTNTFAYEGSEWSTDTSVKYMIDVLGIPAKNIHIGYATYSRNARGAQIDSISPLKGSYNQKNTDANGNFVGGSWEVGTTEWQDFEQYWATISPETGLAVDKYEGYKLLTDKVANADYIYNEDKEFFSSMDTPRTAYLKAQYVKKMGLGGLFTWMADYDSGYMLNAAREGLGYEQTNNASNVNMDEIIFTCGENVATKQECVDLTKLDNDAVAETKANAGQDIVAELEQDKRYRLDGSNSTSAKGELSYQWKKGKVTGIDKSLVKLRKAKTASPEIFITDISQTSGAVTIKPLLTVTDAEGTTSKDRMVLKLVQGDENAAPIAVADGTRYLVRGDQLGLDGSKSSDPDGDELTFQWKQTSGQTVSLPNNGKDAKLTAETGNLKNMDQSLSFELTVSDGLEADKDAITINMDGDRDNNQLPQPTFTVSGDMVVGSTITLDASKSTDDGEIVQYQWRVNHNSGPVLLNGKDDVIATFTPEWHGDYTADLIVWDNFGAANETAPEFINIKKVDQDVSYDYIWPNGKGSYSAGTKVMFPKDNSNVYECFGAWAANCNSDTFAPGETTNTVWINQQWKLVK